MTSIQSRLDTGSNDTWVSSSMVATLTGLLLQVRSTVIDSFAQKMHNVDREYRFRRYYRFFRSLRNREESDF